MVDWAVVGPGRACRVVEDVHSMERAGRGDINDTAVLWHSVGRFAGVVALGVESVVLVSVSVRAGAEMGVHSVVAVQESSRVLSTVEVRVAAHIGRQWSACSLS